MSNRISCILEGPLQGEIWGKTFTSGLPNQLRGTDSVGEHVSTNRQHIRPCDATVLHNGHSASVRYGQAAMSVRWPTGAPNVQWPNIYDNQALAPVSDPSTRPMRTGYYQPWEMGLHGADTMSKYAAQAAPWAPMATELHHVHPQLSRSFPQPTHPPSMAVPHSMIGHPFQLSQSSMVPGHPGANTQSVVSTG